MRIFTYRKYWPISRHELRSGLFLWLSRLFSINTAPYGHGVIPTCALACFIPLFLFVSVFLTCAPHRSVLTSAPQMSANLALRARFVFFFFYCFCSCSCAEHTSRGLRLRRKPARHRRCLAVLPSSAWQNQQNKQTNPNTSAERRCLIAHAEHVQCMQETSRKGWSRSIHFKKRVEWNKRARSRNQSMSVRTASDVGKRDNYRNKSTEFLILK